MAWKSSPEEAETTEKPSPPSASRTSTPASQKVASLGPSLVIRGTLSGEEDLVIEGRVEGEISLRKHSVTVGPHGRVKADVFSKSICVEGQVEGNLFGEDQVTIRRSGKVRGNVTSPRVSLEDGSKFKGAIDMKSPPPAVEKKVEKKPEPAEEAPKSPAAKSSGGQASRVARPAGARGATS